MMRILSAFIMLLVLGLSLVPCCAPVVSKALSMEISPDGCCGDACDAGNEQETETEACSPFFACGSCSGFTLHLSHPVLADMRFPFTASYAPYDVSLNSEYFNKKWQPPKIS